MTENERIIEALKLENQKLRKALTNAEVKNASLSHGNLVQFGTIEAFKNQIKDLNHENSVMKKLLNL